MSRITLTVLLLAGMTWGPAPEAARAGDEGLKVVVHVNFAEADRQGAGLKNITNILKEAPEATVVVVCHGLGIGLVVEASTGHAEQVEALIDQGVRFVACENTMRDKSIGKEELLPGVGTVPAGAVEIIRRQRDGYAYFKP
jgi:uncharacterized protein